MNLTLSQSNSCKRVPGCNPGTHCEQKKQIKEVLVVFMETVNVLTFKEIFTTARLGT